MADFDEHGDLPYDQLGDDDKRHVKETIARQCHKLLDSRRDVFVVGPQTFAAAVWREPENDPETLRGEFDQLAGRAVRAAGIRRVLDWAENDWPMSLGDFLSGMLYGKEWDKKTPPWKLLKTPEEGISAESLGFGHLYPSKD